jgi:uncharacterized membrane protein
MIYFFIGASTSLPIYIIVMAIFSVTFMILLFLYYVFAEYHDSKEDINFNQKTKTTTTTNKDDSIFNQNAIKLNQSGLGVTL